MGGLCGVSKKQDEIEDVQRPRMRVNDNMNYSTNEV